jgi:two-component system, LytTR family, response regulator
MNCLIVDDNNMARLALSQMLSGIDFIKIVGDCSDPIQALQVMLNTPVDLILLDVEMPKMTGLDFLKNTPNRPLVILITAKTDYAVEAFDYNVVDYIVKPVQEDRLLRSLFRAKELHGSKFSSISSEPNDKSFLFVREKNTLNKIIVNDILYLQALGDYVIIYSKDKKHTVHLTLKAFLERFDSPNFMRIHRSYIVALDKLDKVEESTAYIAKHPIPIGDNYRQELMKKINLL